MIFRLPRPGIRFFSPNKILFLLWMFLLVFPKGGIKCSGVPLTWGYLFLTLTTIFSLYRTTFKIHYLRLSAFLLTLPFQCVALYGIATYGIEGGFGISFLLNFFFIPWCFFICLSEYLETLDLSFIFRLIRIGILFISIYGIFLFFFKLLTGKFLEIPFLTVNFHDQGEIANKHIDRGAAFKLISTYNNGNIYGVCLLMLLPLYSLLEKRKLPQALFFLSLLLTLSRTVWIGMVFSILLSQIASKRLSFFQLAFVTGAVILSILAITFSIGFDLLFLFDANLGGRKEQLLVFRDATLLPNARFINVGEMAYLGILANFGFGGLLTFILCMSGPILIGLSRKRLALIQKCILCGLANYLVVSISDAALLFVPVLVFYWFLSAFVFRRDWKPFENS